jgi:hypothetical protein
MSFCCKTELRLKKTDSHIKKIVLKRTVNKSSFNKHQSSIKKKIIMLKKDKLKITIQILFTATLIPILLLEHFAEVDG